jgi:hypothetical protein
MNNKLKGGGELTDVSCTAVAVTQFFLKPSKVKVSVNLEKKLGSVNSGNLIFTKLGRYPVLPGYELGKTAQALADFADNVMTNCYHLSFTVQMCHAKANFDQLRNHGYTRLKAERVSTS